MAERSEQESRELYSRLASAAASASTWAAVTLICGALLFATAWAFTPTRPVLIFGGVTLLLVSVKHGTRWAIVRARLDEMPVPAPEPSPAREPSRYSV